MARSAKICARRRLVWPGANDLGTSRDRSRFFSWKWRYRVLRGRKTACYTGGMGQHEYRLKSLADNELLAELSRIVGRRNQITAEFLAYLAELDERQIFLDLGFASLFEYCVEALGLCESTAGRHIAAARVCRRYPEVFGMVASGALHASALSLLRKHLTPENAGELFELCKRRSARQVEVLLAARFPRPDVRDLVRRFPAQRGRTLNAGRGSEKMSSPGSSVESSREPSRAEPSRGPSREPSREPSRAEPSRVPSRAEPSRVPSRAEPSPGSSVESSREPARAKPSPGSSVESSREPARAEHSREPARAEPLPGSSVESSREPARAEHSPGSSVVLARTVASRTLARAVASRTLARAVASRAVAGSSVVLARTVASRTLAWVVRRVLARTVASRTLAWVVRRVLARTVASQALARAVASRTLAWVVRRVLARTVASRALARAVARAVTGAAEGIRRFSVARTVGRIGGGGAGEVTPTRTLVSGSVRRASHGRR